jgi:DNA-binding MarR family transcriptional regulator
MREDVMQQAPGQSLGFLLNDAARLMRRNFNREVQRLGLTQAQWQVIAYLMHSAGMRQTDLATILEVQPISVARLIDRMAAAGWVERRPDPNDRRAVNLYLTPKAGPIAHELRAAGMRVKDAATRGLSKEQTTLLYECLQEMRQNLAENCCIKDENDE